MMLEGMSASECDVLHFTMTNVPSVSPSTVIYSRLCEEHATMASAATTIAAVSRLCSLENFISLYTYTTADTVIATLDDIPVILQITHSITHSVSILAKEERLATDAAVAMVACIGKVGVHL